MTTIIVQESDQMVEVQIDVTTPFVGVTVPFMLTFTTINLTAEGRLY